MKKFLLFLTVLFIFNVNAGFFDEYSENGICVHVVKNNTKVFSLAPTTSAVAIGERKLADKEVKRIEKKDITDTETGVLLYGKKEGEGTEKREVRLSYNGISLLTFSFKLDPYNGKQLYLESVKKNTDHAGISIGIFREIGYGGGITYRLIIEEDQTAIERLEETQQMPFLSGSQGKLQRIEIN